MNYNMVSELIDFEHKEWNVEVIKASFSERDV